MKPATTSYDIGSTIYDAPITLTYTKGSAGELQWVLRKDAANQRDDTQVISGLKGEQLMAMADAVRDLQQRKCDAQAMLKRGFG